MAIKIITTGGTIDDLDYDSLDKAPLNHRSLVPELLKQSRLTIDYTIKELFARDSRFVTNDDRKLLLKECSSSIESQIIISHGTMTMAHTAQYLGKAGLGKIKTIVLFGAAVPANHKGSDALFNLGAAINAVQLLPSGVYIGMNGHIFSWDNVKKNTEKGVFVPLNQKTAQTS